NTSGPTVGGYPSGCEGTSYHSNTYPITGRVKFEKDLDHSISYGDGSNPQQSSRVMPFIDSRKWVGIKMVAYNLPDNHSVHIEHWVDEKGTNEWKQVLRSVDDGHWATGGTRCGGTSSTVITWGGPLAIFRSDHLLDLDIKYMSVREIQPPSSAPSCPSAPQS